MRSLIFVYNGDTGLFNAATDIAHKLLSPTTYPCRLCALTHGVFKVNKRWSEFVEPYTGVFEFLHRDQYLARHGMPIVSLPVILERLDDLQLRVFLSAEELSAVHSVEELITVIQERNEVNHR